MAQAACRFEKVSKSYRTGFFSRALPVLTEVSFEVQRGETFAYLGHNGAGKTTTIKVLLGLIRLTAGTVEVLGHAPGAPAALARIGYVPENPMFYDHLSGRELLQMVADLHRLPRSEGRRRIDELLELVDMQDRADRRMKGYSKGMRQRIGLAQALINDPELVVLDEPMGGSIRWAGPRSAASSSSCAPWGRRCSSAATSWPTSRPWPTAPPSSAADGCAGWWMWPISMPRPAP